MKKQISAGVMALARAMGLTTSVMAFGHGGGAHAGGFVGRFGGAHAGGGLKRTREWRFSTSAIDPTQASHLHFEGHSFVIVD